MIITNKRKIAHNKTYVSISLTIHGYKSPRRLIIGNEMKTRHPYFTLFTFICVLPECDQIMNLDSFLRYSEKASNRRAHMFHEWILYHLVFLPLILITDKINEHSMFTFKRTNYEYCTHNWFKLELDESKPLYMSIMFYKNYSFYSSSFHSPPQESFVHFSIANH